MKQKIIFLIVLVIITHKNYAQITTAKINAETKVKAEKVYDGKSNFEEFQEINDYKQYIGQRIYTTKKYSSIYFSTGEYCNNYYNKYFTIKNVMQKELRLTQGSKMQFCDVFELIDQNGETYYYKLGKSSNSGAGWVNAGIQPSIILVPFFLNQKKLYESKKYFLIAGPYATRFKNEATNQWVDVNKQLYGGEWSCEVSVLEKEEIAKEVIEDGEKVRYVIEEGNLGTMSYIMKSGSEEIISSPTVANNDGKFCFVKDLSDMKGIINLRFISVEDYNSGKKIQKKQNSKTEIENNNLKAQTVSKLTSKYGKEKAFLISAGKVEIGMTRQMCVDSWGAPLYSKTVKTVNSSKETLFYDLNKMLYLENGILKKIEY